MFRLLFPLFACLLSCLPFKAQCADISDLFKERSKSLVCVRFVVEREESREQNWTWGSLANEEGLILIPSFQVPYERISALREFKVFWNGCDPDGVDAEYLGRDKRGLIDYIRLKEVPEDLVPLSRFVRGKPPKIGDKVWGVGMYSKEIEWLPRCYTSYVSVLIDKPLLSYYCDSKVAQIGGPVFNMQGDFIGFAFCRVEKIYIIADQKFNQALIKFASPDSSDFFYSAEEFDKLTKDLPSTPEGDILPWIGVIQVQTLKRDVAKLMGLENKTAIVVGDVIDKSPAQKAGISKGDIILSIDGKELEHFVSEPFLYMDFAWKLMEKKPGDKVSWGVISAGESQPKNVEIVLAKDPKDFRRSEYKYFKRLGFSIREFLLDDSINRRILKLDVDAAVVQFVKPNSPASSALPTPLSKGDMLKEINSRPVNSYSEAVKVLSEIAEDKNAKDLVLLVEDFNETKVIRIKLD